MSPASSSADGEALIERALRIARVPELYREARWELVRSPAIRQWCGPIDARIRRRDETMPVNWQLYGHGLMILGPVGTGKSSAAALVCREAAAHRMSVLWSYVPDLADAMGESPRRRTEEIRRQTGADLVVWDDFGVRPLAEWEIGHLDQLVEARYRARRPMLVTSNWSANDLRADIRLARMVDRWRERTASQVAVLTGRSMRGAGT